MHCGRGGEGARRAATGGGVGGGCGRGTRSRGEIFGSGRRRVGEVEGPVAVGCDCAVFGGYRRLGEVHSIPPVGFGWEC